MDAQIEDAILLELGLDPEQASAEQAVRAYMRSPRGLTAVELLHLIAWLDGGEWIALPLSDYAATIERAESRGAGRVHDRLRAAA